MVQNTLRSEIMSKAILMSIQPKWCELIASGKKTVEVRKTRPKLDTPFKVYIYCTKDEPLYHSGEKFWCGEEFGNGKVIGEFVCDEIVEHKPTEKYPMYYVDEATLRNACLSADECKRYGNFAPLYAWHISNLVIHDKPKELSEFIKYEKLMDCCEIDCIKCDFCKVKKPPQSWCYVEELSE